MLTVVIVFAVICLTIMGMAMTCAHESAAQAKNIAKSRVSFLMAALFHGVAILLAWFA